MLLLPEEDYPSTNSNVRSAGKQDAVEFRTRLRGLFKDNAKPSLRCIAAGPRVVKTICTEGLECLQNPVHCVSMETKC